MVALASPSISRSLDLAMRLDPVVLAKTAGVEPDPWQEQMLRSESSRLLLNCSRQVGKSTTTATLTTHTALYEPGSPILLLSPTLRQSQELFIKCLEIYRALDRPVPAEAENALSLKLTNGSRIISLPGKEGTIRGMSGVRLLIIDEASRVPDALYMSVLPMLAVSGGRLVLLSSPFGTRGFFYEEWKRRDQWDYFEVPATECPRISPEFLEAMRETMGEWWFLQEFMCQFMDAQTAAFRAADIERIVSEEVETWAL
jgi:Terminase large subunit, T4likevirus-type, N-terminal